MKIIGILGGMSAASTQIYYDKLCSLTNTRLGGLASPDLIIRSVNFAEIEDLQNKGAWFEAGTRLNYEAKKLESYGAEILVLATNTMHKLTDQIMHDVSIPMVHIADATAGVIVKAGFKAPALIATKFTMEQTFYTDRLIAKGLKPILPDDSSRQVIHDIIYGELCLNVRNEASRDVFEDIVRELSAKGADCVILGCTEVCLLLNQDNVDVPVFDTTSIHCEAALRIALVETE